VLKYILRGCSAPPRLLRHGVGATAPLSPPLLLVTPLAAAAAAADDADDVIADNVPLGEIRRASW